MTKRLGLPAVGALMALSALSVGTAGAEPSTPVPPPPSTATSTSTPDELADMVMDAIDHGSPAPSATLVPAPPH